MEKREERWLERRVESDVKRRAAKDEWWTQHGGRRMQQRHWRAIVLTKACMNDKNVGREWKMGEKFFCFWCHEMNNLGKIQSEVGCGKQREKIEI